MKLIHVMLPFERVRSLLTTFLRKEKKTLKHLVRGRLYFQNYVKLALQFDDWALNYFSNAEFWPQLSQFFFAV